MVACAAIGDSIAVGVGSARPDCVTTARVGITSERYITSLLPYAETGAETTIISLGVNDDSSVDTLGNLRRVRRQVRSRTVFWLLPGLKPQVRADIATVAGENGDRLIDTRPEAGRDHLHPSGAGYQVIAAQTYDGGGYSYQPAPVEVAEAPARLRLPGDPAFRITYSEMPRHRSRTAFEASAPTRLYALATPRERIRGLRSLRQAEFAPIRVSYAHLPTPPREMAMRGRESAGRGASRPVASVAGSHAVVRPVRTVQVCPTRGCGGHSGRG